MPKKQEQNPYDTVFNFLFAPGGGAQGKGKPGDPLSFPDVTGLMSGFGDIASNAAMYPVNQLMGDFAFSVDNAVPLYSNEPVEGFKLEFGAGSLSSWLTNPRKMVDKAYGKYQGGKKWGRMGAGVRKIDWAMFAMMGKNAGLEWDESMEVASVVDNQNYSYRAQKPGQISAEKAKAQAEKDFIKHYAFVKHQSEGDIRDALRVSARVGTGAASDKNLRIDTLISELQNRGMAQTDAEIVAQDAWGDRMEDEDLGLWDTVSVGQNYQARQESLRKKSFSMKLNRLDDKKKELEDLRDTARISGNSDMERKVNGQLKNLDTYKNWIVAYGSGKNSLGYWGGVGLGIGKAMHVSQWAKDSMEKFMPAMLIGNTKDLADIFEVQGLAKSGFNFRNGALSGSSARGQFLQGVYYWHPVNVAKGLIWDGRHYSLWAKKLKDSGKNLEFAKFLEGLNGIMPGNVFRNIKKQTFDKLSGKVTGKAREIVAKGLSKFLQKSAKDLAAVPIREMLKQAVIKIITQVLGNLALPGVGVIAGAIVDFGIRIAMKILKPVMELMIMVIVIISILLIAGVLSLGSLIKGGDDQGGLLPSMRHTNLPFSGIGGPGDVAPGGGGFAVISIAPEDYSGNCILAGDYQSCGQGPCGGFTHIRMGTKASDIGGNLVHIYPGIRAPYGGEIIYAQNNLRCRSDGTNYGGVIKFLDDLGYEWTFYHARATKIGRIEEGEAIGQVQIPPEVQWGNCWAGNHLHVEIKAPNGEYVNSETFLNSMGCNFQCPGDYSCF